MHCSKCGKQIAGDSLFCSYCGVKIEQELVQEENTKSRDDLIITACKDCVEKHLKAPSTVKYATVDIKEQDDYGRIYLYVEVDAQNSFGAYIRNKVRVVLQEVNEDGTYKALNTAVCQVSFFNTEDVMKKMNKWNKPF